MANPIAPSVNSLAAFADNMALLSERFRNNVAVMALKAGVVALEAAAVHTPVDTGEARSNWTLDTIKTTVVRPPYAKGSKLGMNERGNYRGAQIEAKRSARSIAKDHILAGRPIYVTNPTPYIKLLNAGFSPQSPGDFDLVAVMQAQGFIASYVRQGKLLTNVDSV